MSDLRLIRDITWLCAREARADDLLSRFVCEVLSGEFDDQAREYWADDLGLPSNEAVDRMRLSYLNSDVAMESAIEKYEAEADEERRSGGILD